MSTHPEFELPTSLRVAPRETPLAEITRKLLQYLLSGDVAPGAKIAGERQLAEAIGVSRSSAREAIKSLSLLGLLDVRQGDGTYLSRSGSDLLPRVIEWGLLLEAPAIMDLLEARAEIEISSAGLAATRSTGDHVAVLQQRLEDMRRAGDDVDAYIEADIAFHMAVAYASGNRIFGNLIASLQSLLQVWATRVLYHAGETHTSLPLHESIVKAIAAGDADKARKAMKSHMDRANRRLRATLDAHVALAPTDSSDAKSS